jgi:hypothetical protein
MEACRSAAHLSKQWMQAVPHDVPRGQWETRRRLKQKASRAVRHVLSQQCGKFGRQIDIPDSGVGLGIRFDSMSFLATLLTNIDYGAIRREMLSDFETQGLGDPHSTASQESIEHPNFIF